MRTLIEQINNKLRNIIEELAFQKESIEESLTDVQDKIDSKIEEAKGYKSSVDSAKLEIKRLEDEIAELENDLEELTNRFSNKDLNVVLETANKEINAKITSRQKEIVKQRDKINELTEKARMIKDLLINLKKDKESKKEKLDNTTSAYTYYEKELSRIINFADENPDNLNVAYFEDTVTTDEPNEESYDINNNQTVDDKVVFDEIASIEKDNDDESNDAKQNSIDGNYEIFEEDEEKTISNDNESTVSFLDSLNSLDDSEDDSNISSLFDKDNNTEKMDFKTLNETIDKEYEDIFGTSSRDISLEPNEEQGNEEINSYEPINELNTDTPNSSFETINPFSAEFEETLNNYESENIDSNENTEIVNFFNNNNLDFNNFSFAAKDKLRNSFNLINYTKTLDILRKNNLNLNNIYNAEDLFSMSHTELENIISKLLLAGQSTKNISYVLNALPLINSMDLQDVIDSYGTTIRDANITDLIIKAKHLKDLGGGNR